MSWDEEAAETLIESIPHPAADLATKRDVADLRAEMQAQFRAQTRWTISVLLVGMGLIEAVGRFG